MINYYTKAEVDTMHAEMNSLIEQRTMINDVPITETAIQIEKDINEISSWVEILMALRETYTKEEINEMLTNHYTTEESNEMLTNHYTKEEVDTLVAAGGGGSCSCVLCTSDYRMKVVSEFIGTTLVWHTPVVGSIALEDDYNRWFRLRGLEMMGQKCASIMFIDESSYISDLIQETGRVLTIKTTDEIHLDAPTTNVSGNLNVSGTLTHNGSQTITHKTNVTGEIGTFCESTGEIYSGYEKIKDTDCICSVKQTDSLNKKVVGIICSEDKFASHGDCLVKVVEDTYEIGDILCPDENGYGRKATDEELMFMMLHAIPRPKITSLNVEGYEGTVACFIV